MKNKKKNKAFNFQHCVNKHVNWKTLSSLLKAQVSSSAASCSDKESDESDEDDDEGEESDDDDDNEEEDKKEDFKIAERSLRNYQEYTAYITCSARHSSGQSVWC